MARRVHWLESTGLDQRRRRASCGVWAPKKARPSSPKRRRRGVDVMAASGFRRRVQGLYVSVIVRPSSEHVAANDNPAALLTLASGVAIAEGVRAVHRTARRDQVAERCADRPAQARGHSCGSGRAGGRASVHRRGVRRESAAAAYPPELATARDVDRSRNEPAAGSRVGARRNSCAFGERYADLRAGRFDAILSAWRRLAPSLARRPGRMGLAGGRRSRTRAGHRRHGALLVRVGRKDRAGGCRRSALAVSP